MRLICPNCDAQYEVDDSAIPETGRDVQCSNCGHAWFQIREAQVEDLTDDLYREPEPEQAIDVPAAIAQTDVEAEGDEDDDHSPVSSPLPVQRTLDESVLSVLREEAEREVAARKAEATGIEMQGDLGLPPPVSVSVGSAASAAAAEASDMEKRIAALKGEPVPQSRPAARRDLLPDIEEINSSLRPNTVAASLDNTGTVKSGSSGSGFRSGFVLVLILAALAVVLYLMAPQISAQIPGAADAMASYVSVVDSLRLALDGLMRKATGVVNGLTGG
ncbi:MAG: zinc-ribbon domain-containing protein [Paracoccaceae bacterium]